MLQKNKLRFRRAFLWHGKISLPFAIASFYIVSTAPATRWESNYWIAENIKNEVQCVVLYDELSGDAPRWPEVRQADLLSLESY